ncbi:MAG TPA: zf-HC2 domain-containing protein [Ilumatobacteraceae bacterium]|nr:zf-HC2 domain-containing protein [Ilumatobacteraceae bacterium]HRB02347.1 zf-HC2 domain-containing protein [Ilumatobacteraceae bacterium]
MTDHDPNDELNPQHELASAYLDGVASPAERARVEASAELMALVASFAVVRARIADVAPVAPDTRDAAFAAAFAEFDAPALAPAAAAAAVIPMRSSRRWSRPVLSVAAAVLLVGAIGVAAKGGFSGDDSTSSADLEKSSKVAAADPATESAADTMTAMSPSTIGSINGSAQAPLVVDSPEQLKALALNSVADSAPPTGGSPETTALAGETTADTLAPLDVVSYGRAALGCLTAQQEFLADIQYQGTFAIAARDTVTGMVSAITDECTVLTVVGP